jgi:hypothetical protein
MANYKLRTTEIESFRKTFHTREPNGKSILERSTHKGDRVFLYVSYVKFKDGKISILEILGSDY